MHGYPFTGSRRSALPTSLVLARLPVARQSLAQPRGWAAASRGRAPAHWRQFLGRSASEVATRREAPGWGGHSRPLRFAVMFPE
jgi:hypothetical protein